LALTQLSATELRRLLKAKEVSAPEIAQAHLDRIAAHGEQYNAFLHVSADLALQMAKRAQEMIDAGEVGPMTGIPVALKDNINVQNEPTTCASRILEGFVSPFDSGVTARLKSAGAILLGKTNLDEFAMGASTETGAFGPARNPWDLERSPGGSSGGSAAAVAAEMATVALGSDTGGSIRQPASLCGIVGYKPTYGRVSRYGLVAFGSSLDQIGPFGRTVEDAALLASAISGHDPHDSTSMDLPPIDVSRLKEGNLEGKRFAVPKEVLGEGIHPGVLEAVLAALAKLESAGASIEEVSLPAIKYGVTTYYIIAPAEASSNLARFDGIRYGLRAEGKGHIGVVERTRSEGFGHEVKARIMIGTYALSAGYYDAYYLKAQQVRALMVQQFNGCFDEYDGIVMPTSPVPAFKIGELSDDPLALKQLDYCTIPANMGGFPAISLNCGFAEGLPVGVQFVGRALQDETVLQFAYTAEQILGATQRPPLP
jgi:aspartyl-tRNA(Asn)/glutamyl-tRNA(Gln) amidotransferase subunit A